MRMKLLVIGLVVGGALLGLRWLSEPGSSERSSPVGPAQDEVPAGNLPLTQSAELEAPTDVRTALASPDESAVDETLPSAKEQSTRVRISGLVLDPNGNPVAEALIANGDLAALRAHERNNRDLSTAQSNAAGVFEFELEPGEHVFVARAKGFAPSGVVLVQAAASVHGVELRLRRAGAIEGEVFAVDGSLRRAGRVTAFSNGAPGQHEVKTDGDGRFRFDDLLPGGWTVQAWPHRHEFDEGGVVAELNAIASAQTTVVANEVAWLSMGAPPDSPVLLKGSLRVGDSGVRGYIQLIQEGDTPLDGHALTQSSSDGLFEIELPEPGNYMAFATISEPRAQGVFAIQVPAVDEYWTELQVPGGLVRGHVVDPAGASLSGAAISLRRIDQPGGRVPMDLASEATTTGEKGEFIFEGLASGRYELVVGPSEDGKLGLVAGPQFELAQGEERGDFELTLSPGTRIEGTVVLPSGEPAPGATVFLRDAGGRLLTLGSRIHAGQDGRFTTPPVSGKVFLFARGDGLASSEGVESALILEPATILTVRVQDAAGVLVAARLSCLDSEGREAADLRDVRRMWDGFRGGFRRGQFRVGPLAPGEYRVEAIAMDGSSASQTVTLIGEEAYDVQLILK